MMVAAPVHMTGRALLALSWLVSEAAGQAITTQLSASKPGYDTYQVSMQFTGVGRSASQGGQFRDAYAVFGEPGSTMVLPPAFQVPAPFGTNVGPTNPAFFGLNPDVQFDSFVTIGMGGPALQTGTLSSIGIDFATWNERTGMSTDDGAVFFMDPEHGATSEPVTFLQLTVPSGTPVRGQFAVQGRSQQGEDWMALGVTFSSDSNPDVPAAPTPAPASGQGGLRPFVTTVTTGKAGYTTYQVGATFPNVRDVYALFGQPGATMVMPPAFQVPAPFGTNVGPTNPAFFGLNPDTQFDSFLTIGVDGPALQTGTLSSIGIDFATWDERTGMSTDDGAVFFMDPEHGATTQPVVFAQLTLPDGVPCRGTFSAQGRSAGGSDALGRSEDWTAMNLNFDSAAADSPPSPPPPPPRPPPPPAPPPPPQIDQCWLPPDYSTTPCQHGATCTTVGDTYQCRCLTGFSGRNCEVSATPPPPPPVSTGEYAFVTPVTSVTATSAYGTTYRLSLTLGSRAENIYTIFGQAGSALAMPAAYQVVAPFGVDIAGVPPGFFAAMPDAAYDSWLTVGSTDGSGSSAMSSVGINWGSWTSVQGLRTENGAVFWMSPDAGPSKSQGVEEAVIAQITLPAGTRSWPTAPTVSAQGRPMMHGIVGESHPDWTEYNINFPPLPSSSPAPPPRACLAQPCVHGVCSDSPSQTCYDSCLTHGDGECDDGGPAAEWNVCEFGTDCADCGVRAEFTCACEPGWDGLLCDTQLDPCFNFACFNGGVCESQCYFGQCSAQCVCPEGFGGAACDVVEIAAPPPQPMTLGLPSSGVISAPYEEDFYVFSAQAGATYLLETDAGTLSDTVMVLYNLDGVTVIVENDDDTRTGNLDSYIEWECPTTGNYLVMVRAFGEGTGTYTLLVSAAEGACTDGGVTLTERALEISFQPVGGTTNNQRCQWTIECPARQMVDLTFSEFATEAGYDTVTLGGMAPAPDVVLSGQLWDLDSTEYVSSGSTMAISFVSDESVGDTGFVARYVCITPRPPPPPPPAPARNKREVVRAATSDGFPVAGHVMAPGQQVWFSLQATAGAAYQMETNTEDPFGDGVLDSIMFVCDAHPCTGTHLAENDDDERTAAGQGSAQAALESYLEWTAPSDGTFYIVVAGYGTSVGTFSLLVTAMADPCDLADGQGVVLAAPSATISFMPQGDMAHHPGHMMCDWVIRCPDPNQHVRLTFDQFRLNPSTASGDHVALFDGPNEDARKFRPNGQLSGSLNSLPQRTWESSGSAMLVQFTSDETAPQVGEGFEAYYDCV